MSTKKQDVTIVGAGVAACAVCCAGPILGFLAAIGLGTAVGAALWGAIAVVIGSALGCSLSYAADDVPRRVQPHLRQRPRFS